MPSLHGPDNKNSRALRAPTRRPKKGPKRLIRQKVKYDVCIKTIIRTKIPKRLRGLKCLKGLKGPKDQTDNSFSFAAMSPRQFNNMLMRSELMGQWLYFNFGRFHQNGGYKRWGMVGIVFYGEFEWPWVLVDFECPTLSCLVSSDLELMFGVPCYYLHIIYIYVHSIIAAVIA